MYIICFRSMASTSAVLGAATGAGLALLVAMTLVIYRYYALKRKAKEWSALERCSSNGSRQNRGQGSNYTVSQQQVRDTAHVFSLEFVCSFLRRVSNHRSLEKMKFKSVFSWSRAART